VVINPAEYQAMQEAAANDWAVIDQMQAQNAIQDHDTVLADAKAAVAEVRAAHRERP
jgi:IS5 family transposase